MRTILIHAFFGFLTGVIFVFFAIFGLVIGAIGFLKPLLAPGMGIVGNFMRTPDERMYFLGVVLNGIIYALLFFLISFMLRYVKRKGVRVAFIVLIIFLFLLFTGMIADVVEFVFSPYKSWILNLGA